MDWNLDERNNVCFFNEKKRRYARVQVEKFVLESKRYSLLEFILGEL